MKFFRETPNRTSRETSVPLSPHVESISIFSIKGKTLTDLLMDSFWIAFVSLCCILFEKGFCEIIKTHDYYWIPVCTHYMRHNNQKVLKHLNEQGLLTCWSDPPVAVIASWLSLKREPTLLMGSLFIPTSGADHLIWLRGHQDHSVMLYWMQTTVHGSNLAHTCFCK